MAKDQPPQLPLDIQPQQYRHDYGGAYDSGDTGHEYPFVQPVGAEPEGVSVSLTEREATLHKIAKLYALRARADGLEKAVKDPQKRAELRERYDRELGRLVGNTITKAKYTLADERVMLEPLLRTTELKKAGFEEADIDEAALHATIDIRHGFGVSVGDAERRKNLRTAARTARNARPRK